MHGGFHRTLYHHHQKCRTLQSHHLSSGVGGFLPGVKQIANVAALPGIVGVSTS